MIFNTSSLPTNDSFNFSWTESNYEDFSSFIPINENINDYSPELSLDENEDEKRYFLDKKEVKKCYNLRPIFRKKKKKKKRGPKKHKITKKLNILIAIEIILLVKFKYIILIL